VLATSGLAWRARAPIRLDSHARTSIHVHHQNARVQCRLCRPVPVKEGQREPPRKTVNRFCSRRDARALEKPSGLIEHGKDNIYSSRSEIKIFRVLGYEKAENLTFERIPCLQDCEFNEQEGE